MKPYILLLGASVALAACDSRPTVSQNEPVAQVVKSQELSAAEQEAIAEKVAQRLAAQREQESRLDAAREAEIREQVRREVEEEFARREAQNPPPPAVAQPAREPEPDPAPPVPRGSAVQVSAWGNAGYDMFYEALSPYGAWYETNDLGYVWQPNIAARNNGWRPYVDGQWADSDQGWIWVTDEPFGWATYHYGRWASLENIGWVWVPGTEWAPAWVSWREANDYVGWAPLPPRSIQGSVEIGGWADETYDIGPESYNFIPIAQFHQPTYRTVVINYVENVRIIEHTRNVTNIYVRNNKVCVGGPRYDEIKVRCPGLIKTRPIARVDSREKLDVRENRNGDTIVVFSPKIDRKEGQPREISRKFDRPRIRTGWEVVHDPAVKTRLQQQMSGKNAEPVKPVETVSARPSVNDQKLEDRLREKRDEVAVQGNNSGDVVVNYTQQNPQANQRRDHNGEGRGEANQGRNKDDDRKQRPRANDERPQDKTRNEARLDQGGNQPRDNDNRGNRGNGNGGGGNGQQNRGDNQKSQDQGQGNNQQKSDDDRDDKKKRR